MPPTIAALLRLLSTTSTSALGACPVTPGAAHGRAGGREHECHDEQRAEEEQQPVADAEPALVLAGGIEQVAHRGEDDGRRLAPLDQVQQERHTGGEQAGEQPRDEETIMPASSRARPAQRVAERRVGHDPMVLDAAPPARRVPAGHRALHRLVIGLGPVARAQHDRRPRLRVLEARLRRTRERHLGGIHEVQHQRPGARDAGGTGAR